MASVSKTAVDAYARALAANAAAEVTALEALVGNISGTAPFFIDALAVAGTLAVANNVFPAGIRVMQTASIIELTGRVGTAPVGGPVTFALTKNATVVATLSIAAGTTSNAVTFSAVPVKRGDILNINVTAVGTTTAGANLAFTVADSLAIVAGYSLADVPGLWAYYDMALQGGVDGQVLNALDDTFGTRNLVAAGSPSPLYEADAFGTGLPGVLATLDPGYFIDPSPFRNAAAFTFALPIRLLGNNTDGFLFSTNFGIQAQMFGNDRFVYRLSNNGTAWTTTFDAPNLSLNANKLLIFRVGGGRAQLEVNGVQTNDVAFVGPLGNVAGRFSLGSNLDGGGPVQNVALGTPVVSLNYLTGTDLAALRTKLGASIGLTL